jgi:prevent-host-death family protein
MPLISIAQGKAHFASVVSRAEAGEEIVVTRNGKPVARIVPLPPVQTFPFGDLAGKVWVSDDLSLPEDVIAAFEESEPLL